MKMNQVMPTEERFDFSIVDSIIAYANEHNQRVFGHNLIWHSSTPEWVRIKATENPDWLLPFMRDYISVCWQIQRASARLGCHQ